LLKLLPNAGGLSLRSSVKSVKPYDELHCFPPPNLKGGRATTTITT
jgi:hypothetical protein